MGEVSIVWDGGAVRERSKDSVSFVSKDSFRSDLSFESNLLSRFLKLQ